MLIGSVVGSVVLKIVLPDLPFVLRIWLVFLINLALGVMVARLTAAPSNDQPVALTDIDFDTTAGFNRAAVVVTLLLALIYVAFWSA